MLKITCFLALSFLISNDVKRVKLIEPINLGGTHLFSVRGHNASKRSDIIYDRLRCILVPSLESSDITVNKIKDQAVIMVDDNILVTITDEDAKLNHSTKFGLANKIQKKLSEVLPNLVPLDTK